jgi:hypothetical protein
MFDVFTEELEVLIKEGLANLYWYKGDLRKAWLRAGVNIPLCDQIAELKDVEGRRLTKRAQMDALYERLRLNDFAYRLRVSREFVRILVEHKNFVPQEPRHRIEVAERAALKLKAAIADQAAKQEEKDRQRRTAAAAPPTYQQELTRLRESFEQSMQLAPQQKGYQLERIFADLMRISGILVEEPFSNKGEQLDGAIKHEGVYYLVELKWIGKKVEPQQVGAFYFKVEGKMGARGLVIAMNGFTDGVMSTLTMGKEHKVLLLDGNHLANVIYGLYTFQQLLDHAIRHATLKGVLYCPHQIG